MPKSVRKVLVACDAFKDAVSAVEAGQAIRKGLMRNNPDLDVTIFPLADGGEGTVDILHYHLGGRRRTVSSTDPLGRPVNADYFISSGNTAFIEMASVAGLQLLGSTERNPLITSTKGLGKLIFDAVDQGVVKLIVGVGGSATNDCGLGMASALGWRFYSASGFIEDPVGKDLGRVVRIEGGRTQGLELLECTVLCDVDNVLFGPTGAAFTYAGQKGATTDQIVELDNGLRNIAKIIKRDLGVDVADLPGAGAAGGMGAAGVAFLDATLRPGAQVILEQVGLMEALRQHDAVITGEGKLDGQTLHGKLIHQLCIAARSAGVPAFALCGRVEASEADLRLIGLRAAVEISSRAWPLEEALQRTAEMLELHASKLSLQLNEE